MSKLGHWIFLMGLLCCILTACTGESASQSEREESSVVIEESVSAPESESEKEPESPVQEQKEKAVGREEKLEPVASDGEWNTWEFSIPINDHLSEFFTKENCVIQITLPSNWIPKEVQGEQPYIFYSYFYEELEDGRELERAEYFSVNDYSENEYWVEREDKWLFPENRLNSYAPNEIMREVIEVNGYKWFVYNGVVPWFADELEEGEEQINYCSISTPIDDDYQFGLNIITNEKDFSDPEARELIEIILASWKVISIEPNDLLEE